MIDLVVEATGCNDAWYYEVAGALEEALPFPDLLTEAEWDALGELISTHFSSWTGPTDEERALVLDDFAAARNQREHRFYRIMNEVPTLLMIGIVICVIVKPF